MKHLDKALIGAGAALVLSGGIAAAALGPSNVGTAVMASLPGDITLAVQNNGHLGGPGFFATAATYIGITEDALRTELGTGKSLADVAVAHGKTRDGLIAALVQASTTEITTLVDTKNPFPAPPAGAPGRGFRVEGAPLAAASTYLGISEADLRTKLQAGQNLGQIAAATAGKSRDGLIAAIVADENGKIDAAQTSGRITADQATQMKAQTTARVTALVDGTAPTGPGGFGFPGGPRGHR
jgi:hypothetical protein